MNFSPCSCSVPYYHIPSHLTHSSGHCSNSEKEDMFKISESVDAMKSELVQIKLRLANIEKQEDVVPHSDKASTGGL